MQLHSWQAFREWQKNNRGSNDKEDECAAQVEEWWRQEVETRARTTPGDKEYWERCRLQRLRAAFERTQKAKGVDGGEEAFSAFVEEWQQRDLKVGRTWPGMAEHEYRQALRACFDRMEEYRRRTRFCCLRDDYGQGRFAEYIAEAKRRLTRHGFPRAFQLDLDPAQ